MDCMNHNDYDRDKCLDYFQAYRDCKKAWVSRLPGIPDLWLLVAETVFKMEQRKADRRAGKDVS